MPEKPRTPRVVGRCREIESEGRECGGLLREDFVKREPKFLAQVIIRLLGDTKLVGYRCDKCGAKISLTDPFPFNFFRSMSR